MKAVLDQLKLLFVKPSQAVDSNPSIIGSVSWTAILLFATFLLLFKNALNPSIVSVSPVQLFTSDKILESFLANVSAQFLLLCIPFAIVLGADGFRKLLSNLAILQVPALIMAVFGFLYEMAFWPLYKSLPISGLQAKAAFDAIFLLYPALLMLFYRYVIIWIVAVKAGANGNKVFLMILIHAALCACLYFLGGLI